METGLLKPLPIPIYPVEWPTYWMALWNPIKYDLALKQAQIADGLNKLNVVIKEQDVEIATYRRIRTEREAIVKKLLTDMIKAKLPANSPEELIVLQKVEIYAKERQRAVKSLEIFEPINARMRKMAAMHEEVYVHLQSGKTMERAMTILREMDVGVSLHKVIGHSLALNDKFMEQASADSAISDAVDELKEASTQETSSSYDTATDWYQSILANLRKELELPLPPRTQPYARTLVKVDENI